MKLSIIVCTQNRAHAISACLDSIAIALAHAAPLDAEIVVVDNGSTDNTSQIITQWASASPFPVRQLFEPRKGLSAARNCALRAAQGDLLAWTDDDCRLSKEYVVDLLRHASGDTELVLRGGRVELGDPADLPMTIKTERTAKRWRRDTRTGHVTLSNSILGCNMTMHRAVIDCIGFFDERLGAGTSIPSGEDTDCFFRAYLADMPIEYVPDMLIFHHHGRNRSSDARKLLHNRAIGEGAIYAKYLFKAPYLCRQFYWNIKDALKEIVSGPLRNDGFSYKMMVSYGFLGAAKFLIASTFLRRLAH